MSAEHSPDPGISDASSWLQSRRPAFDELVAGIDEYAVFTMTPAGRILDWNSGAERIYGYPGAAIIGQDYGSFFSDAERSAWVPAAALEMAAREGSFNGEGWRLRRTGERFWGHVTITALRSEGGTVEGFLKITRDMTQWRMTMEALRESEERFRLLVASVHDYAIFMLDPEGHVVSWNNGAERIKGYDQEEILGQHFSIFYPPQAVEGGVPQKLLNQAMKEGRSEQEGWRMRKDGTRFWGHIVITPLREPAGELRGFAKITRDLSDRLQVETLREAGRRKDAFLATLAHELRNPLAPILPGVDIILRSPDNPAKVAEVAGMLRRQVNQMARLIDDLVDVSRINTGKIDLQKARVSFAEVLERALEAIRPMVERKRQVLIVDLSPPVIQVEADPHRLAQVISNLLSNASKYTPEGGHLSLTASAESDGMLRIVVEDDGRGIKKEDLGTIFELFDQGGGGLGEGLGIGLTLARTLTEMHGGRISVESSGPGQGSEFTLSLPGLVPADGRARAGKQVSTGALQKEGSLRVIVADDGKSAADILGMFFQMEGMEAVVAYDGAEAVEAARNFDPDLAILDLGMPRLDGLEACKQIRSMYPHAVMIALSGWGSKEDRRRTADAGFDEHLVKPVAPDDPRQIVGRYFTPGGKRQRDRVT